MMGDDWGDSLKRLERILAPDNIEAAADRMLIALGRALAPQVNAKLAKIRPQKIEKLYCPGCGDEQPDGELCFACREYDEGVLLHPAPLAPPEPQEGT